MKKNYQRPITQTHVIQPVSVLASSPIKPYYPGCNEFCKHWYFCKDRKYGIECHHKEY